MSGFWQNRYETNYKEQNYKISIPLLDYIKNLPQHAVVLDYGSGIGRVSEAIHKEKPNAKIHLFDISEKAILNSTLQHPNIYKTHTEFNPIFNYTHMIFHRVFHNMKQTEVKNLVKNLPISSFFISVRHVSCPKLIVYRKKPNMVEIEKNTFANRITKRYIHFFTEEELVDIIKPLKPKTTGFFQENSFTGDRFNKYFYVS